MKQVYRATAGRIRTELQELARVVERVRKTEGLSDFAWCSKRTCRPRPTYGCRA